MNHPPQSITATVIQNQLDAYNQKDLERLLSIYSEDAELYEHPSTLLAKGREQLHERFSARFQEPHLHATLVQRMIMGTFVVDQEIVTRTFPEGRGTLELIMIYQVEGEHIIKAWSLPGKKTILK